jgi:hypothetical protein
MAGWVACLRIPARRKVRLAVVRPPSRGRIKSYLPTYQPRNELEKAEIVDGEWSWKHPVKDHDLDEPGARGIYTRVLCFCLRMLYRSLVP